jgi:DNA-3-methyladenine glycosylase I
VAGDRRPAVSASNVIARLLLLAIATASWPLLLQIAATKMTAANAQLEKNPIRCRWASNELAIRYHDEEWGVPVHEDRTLFEFLILEGAQAGLSWNTILNKRENYRAAFDRFDPEVVAAYDRRRIQQLLRNPGIVRNKLKIASAVANAKAFLLVQKEFGNFDRYIWQFVEGTPRLNSWKFPRQVPARTRESDAMSKDLKSRGFNFVGTTICYAFMQAVGMVNDHVVGCFRYQPLARLRERNRSALAEGTGCQVDHH